MNSLMNAIEAALTCLEAGDTAKATEILRKARNEAKKPIDPQSAQAAARDMHRLALGIRD